MLEVCRVYTETSASTTTRLSRLSLHQESDGVATVACSMRRGAGLLKHKNILSGQLAPVW